MKILMRAPMSPLVNESPLKVFAGNLMGSNIGNMIFANSVCRGIMTEGTQVDTIKTRQEFTDWEVKYINEKYDYMVFPFANAFRKSFIPELLSCASLIERLNIPVAIVGVGLQQAPEEAARDELLVEATKRLVNAALNKGNIIGVRGEQTGKYLSLIGYQAERDFTVIGCPSLYTYGEDLPELRMKDLTPESKVSYNSKCQLPDEFHQFMRRNAAMFEDAIYVPQVIQEIYRMYAGIPWSKSFCDAPLEYFPKNAADEIYVSGKGQSFVNVKSWTDYLKGRDFSFGSRIHGNITAILSGTPAIVLVSDSRIRELVDYHHIPWYDISELREDTSIFDLYDKADFSQIHKNHKKNAEHYIEFLNKNNLPHIFTAEYKGKKAPMDLALEKVNFEGPLLPYTSLPVDEQVLRVEEYMRYLRSKRAHRPQKRIIVQADGTHMKFPKKPAKKPSYVQRVKRKIFNK